MCCTYILAKQLQDFRLIRVNHKETSPANCDHHRRYGKNNYANDVLGHDGFEYEIDQAELSNRQYDQHQIA